MPLRRSGSALGMVAVAYLLLAIGSTACSEDGDAPNVLLTRAEMSILDSEPVVDIGGTGPDGQPVLLDVRSVTRVGHHLVIADHGAPSVLFFDLDGRRVRSVGRDGGGPGEFRQLSGAHACSADSVFAWDSRLHRMTVLDTVGAIAREYRTPILALDITCSRTGVVVVKMHSRESYRPTGGYEVQYSSILLADTRGDTIAVLDSIHLGEARPLGPMTSVATANDRVFVATAESSYVDVYDLDGDHQGRVQTGVARREATREAQEAHVDELLDGMYRDNPQQLAEFRRMFLDMPMPAYLPAYRRVMAAPSAMLWVDMTAPGDSTTWLRTIAPDGTILGDAHLPRNLEPIAVDNEYLFARYDDSAGEPHIVLYRIRLTTN